MISELSKRISLFLCRKKIIDADDLEIYKNRLEISISTLTRLTVTILIGLVFQMFFLSVIFFFLFAVIKLSTIGYHIKSHLNYNLVFSSMACLVLGFTHMTVSVDNYTISIHILLLMLSILIIWRYTPVVEDNEPMDSNKEKNKRSISICLVVLVSIASCLIFRSYKQTSVLMVFTLLAVAVFIAILKIIKGGNYNEKD